MIKGIFRTFILLLPLQYCIYKIGIWMDKKWPYAILIILTHFKTPILRIFLKQKKYFLYLHLRARIFALTMHTRHFEALEQESLLVVLNKNPPLIEPSYPPTPRCY